MKKEDRIALISSITHNQVFGEGRRLRYKGETKEFKIFEIPMEALIYNVQNGRIGSVVKTFEHSYGVLDPEKQEDSLTIAKMLYNSNEIANKKTHLILLNVVRWRPVLLPLMVFSWMEIAVLPLCGPF